MITSFDKSRRAYASPIQVLGNFLEPVLLPFVLSRGMVFVLAMALEWLLSSGRIIHYAYIGTGPLTTLAPVFDGNWYLDIVKHGYSTSADFSREQNYHFFPLYPFLITLVGSLTGLAQLPGGYNIVGVLLSHIFFLAALAMLYRLVLLVWNDATLARRTVWLLCALPWAYVFSMLYAESLFLMIIVAALLVAYRTYNSPGVTAVLLAGLCAGLSTLTRPQGFVVALSVAWMVAVAPKGLRLSTRVLYATLAGLPSALAMLGFALYIAQHTGSGNLLAISKVTNAWGSGLIGDLERVFVLPPANSMWHIDLFATLALVGWIAFTIWLVAKFIGIQRTRGASVLPAIRPEGTRVLWAFVIFAVGSLLITVLNNPMNLGWGRYFLLIFPVFWPLLWKIKEERRFRMLLISCASFQCLLYAGAIIAQVTP